MPIRQRIYSVFSGDTISMTPGLQWRTLLQRSGTAASWPLAIPASHRISTFNGSAGLHRAGQALGLQRGDTVLLPAYCCGAEIGPFADLGCHLAFYDNGTDLQLDLSSLTRQLDERVKAVLVTHNLGFAQEQIEAVSALCARLDIALIEDCAHALFANRGTQPLGSFGTMAIFSQRKTLGLTEGGMLLSNAAALPSADAPRRPAFWPWLDRLQQAHRRALRQRPHGARAIRSAVFEMLWWPLVFVLKGVQGLPSRADHWTSPDAEGPEARPVRAVGMSRLMMRVWQRSDACVVVQKRRAHYRRWLQQLPAMAHCQPLLPILPAGCCPLYFPVRSDRPAALVDMLARHRIESFFWWQHLHPAVDWAAFPNARKLKQHIVVLPLHHDLQESQIDRMAAIIRQFDASIGTPGSLTA